MNFRKTDTLAIKGVAILFLLYHHLFLSIERYSGFEVNFFPFTESFVNQISSFMKICVGMFTFLSGYGMTISVYKKYHKYKMDRNQVSEFLLCRYKNLMEGWIFIFLFSNLICFCIDKRPLEIYGRSGSGIVKFFFDMIGISNVIGTPTLITTWWYIGLAISLIFIMPVLLWLYDSFGVSLAVIVVLLPKALGLSLTKMIWWILAFVLGIIFADKDILYRFKCWIQSDLKIIKIIASIIALIVFIIVRQSEIGQAYPEIFDPITAVYMIMICYVFLSKMRLIYRMLQFLGKHSMNIFLTHTFIRGYYCKEWIYSFHNHFLIFLVLLFVSLILSIIVEFIKKLLHYDHCYNKLWRKVTVCLYSGAKI